MEMLEGKSLTLGLHSRDQFLTPLLSTLVNQVPLLPHDGHAGNCLGSEPGEETGVSDWNKHTFRC